ncbi:MAG: alpha/beta hydrolase [bacterium]|nr:alpha/beta hydrolase [bacterium]
MIVPLRLSVLIAAVGCFLAAPASYGATRIQLVAEIPHASLTVLDHSGEIVGEVDGIATDALDGSNPGEVIPGASLHLSTLPTPGLLTWGHVDPLGDFVADLPANGQEGTYSVPSAGDAFARVYTPPTEFDLTGPHSSSERSLHLAVRIERTQSESVVISKEIVLVKPPVVLVHGINSGPSAWTNFQTAFETAYGFRTYTVDHSGGSYSSGAPTYGGNGDPHDVYHFVRGGVPGLDGVSEALEYFRTGHSSAHPGKKIAVAKVDIVASSYGGLLSRWYTEQAADYAGDVRKLITMGTPHRGTPITNMNVEAFANPTIAAADAQLLSPIVSVGGSLQIIDDFGFIRWKDGGFPEDVVPALRVMTVDSDVLGVLNEGSPFRDDLAYGSIVGTDEYIDFLLIPTLNVFNGLEPTRGLLTAQKSYFPWMPILDGGPSASDAVVPTWSQTLPARTTSVPFDHLSFHDSSTVQSIVSIWLQDSTLPRGAAHRAAFQAQVIPQSASRGNAYVGSALIGNQSVGGGLVHDAINQVEFSGPTLGSSGGLPRLGSSGGVVTATMTGMSRVVSAPGPQTQTLRLVEDDVFDTTLELVSTSVDPGGTPNGELFAFSIEARIGRDQSASILGPDGLLSNYLGGEIWSVGYEIDGQPDYDQSPWTDIDFPAFSLPTVFVPGETPPFVVTSAGSPFTLEGGVHASAGGGASQSVNAQLYEDNFFTDTLLEDRTFPIPTPSDSFPGILVPYSEPEYHLFKNTSGHVAGEDNSSFETNADVYQYLIQPAGSNPSSSNVSVDVAP